MADNDELIADDIKKEPEERVADNFENENRTFGDDNSIKNEPTEKEVVDTAKSDDDMQG